MCPFHNVIKMEYPFFGMCSFRYKNLVTEEILSFITDLYCPTKATCLQLVSIEIIQDFLRKLAMKPDSMHLVEITILSLP